PENAGPTDRARAVLRGARRELAGSRASARHRPSRGAGGDALRPLLPEPGARRVLAAERLLPLADRRAPRRARARGRVPAAPRPTPAPAGRALSAGSRLELRLHPDRPPHPPARRGPRTLRRRP